MTSNDLLWTERAEALVDGLDLDGIEGDELGPSDLVGLHVRQALENLRLGVDDDRIHELRKEAKAQTRTQMDT